jgi:hypothetical protein
MPERLRIAVTGLAATYPFGGVFWDYLQYPLGFQQLGHEVLFIEDNGLWSYDPGTHTLVGNGANNARILAEWIRRMTPELSRNWHFRDAEGRCYGKTEEEAAEFCRTADLFLNISGTCWMREEYFAARKVAFLDSDPMYTQAAIPEYVVGTADEATQKRIETMRNHDVFFSFGENVGQPDCGIPTELFGWKPTRQPIVLDRFAPNQTPVGKRRRVFTTVASWEPAEKGPMVRGVQYWGKSVEFERMMDLPRRFAEKIGIWGMLELAMSGRAPKERLVEAGWTMIDPTTVSGTPEAYREYLARSLGEWSVAKNAYVAAHTGWFSCRSACYLALGVPVVVQDTGFSRFLPTGEGLLCFDDAEGAIAGLASVLTNPERHAAQADEIAREYFDARKVLGQLIEDAFSVE